MIKRVKKSTVIITILLLSFVTIVWFLSTFIVKIIIVKGFSMYPTYKSGEVLLMSLTDKNFQKGDIIVIAMDNGDRYIKRIIAVGGDTVQVDSYNNEVSVNGTLIDETYAFYNTLERDGNNSLIVETEYVVPEDYLFVMGDNRNNSFDSRNKQFGFISIEKIVGKIIL